jgi:hypothetical protein
LVFNSIQKNQEKLALPSLKTFLNSNGYQSNTCA